MKKSVNEELPKCTDKDYGRKVQLDFTSSNIKIYLTQLGLLLVISKNIYTTLFRA